MIVPTKRLWGLVALGIPIAALGGASGNGMLPVLYNLGLLGAAVITSRMGPDPRKLKVWRSFDSVLSVRVPNVIEVTVRNENLEPVRGRVRDEAPPQFVASRREFPLELNPEAETTLRYTLTPNERGSDYFRGTWVRLACPLGLVERQERLSTEQPVRIYPNVLALREFELLKQQGRLREMGIRRTRTRGLGTDFESLREYGEGDDYRKIDWKASARRGKLVVRQFEQERNQSVLIAIDLGRHMLAEVDGVRKLDRALDAALMLAHAAVVAGDQVGLLVYADSVRRYIPPRKGKNQVGFVIEALHDLVAEPVESDPLGAFAYLQSRWKRRSLMVLFTDLEEPDRAREMVTAMGSVVRRHLTVLARVTDPRLSAILREPLNEPAVMYRRAAALLLSDERRDAGAVLNAAGIHNLEAEPEDLAAALVSYYFTVKARSLL